VRHSSEGFIDIVLTNIEGWAESGRMTIIFSAEGEDIAFTDSVLIPSLILANDTVSFPRAQASSPEEASYKGAMSALA
jgi:hypothetical protein